MFDTNGIQKIALIIAFAILASSSVLWFVEYNIERELNKHGMSFKDQKPSEDVKVENINPNANVTIKDSTSVFTQK